MVGARLFVAALCTLFFQIAWADQVVPSDRVQTRLRVRHDPDVTSAVVGHLNKGEHAKLEGGVPFWFEVTLTDGTHGFVSKAWSQVVPDAATTGELLRLGEWNVKKLGHGTKDLALVAKIIDEHFDIVAIVEVMQKGGGHPGYDALAQALGTNWVGMVTATPRPNITSGANSGNSEFYAIFYRPARIQPCDGWTDLQYLADNDGGPDGTGEDVFSREPAFGCFAVRLANGTTGFDFMLAAYHARFKGGTAKIKNEVKHVTAVFQAMGQARPGENDRILVGDFNLVTSDLESVLGPQVTTVGTASTLHGDGTLTSHLYDHLLLFDQAATTEIVGSPEVLDVRGEAASPQVYFQTVSDHLPIQARFRPGPDDD